MEHKKFTEEQKINALEQLFAGDEEYFARVRAELSEEEYRKFLKECKSIEFSD